MQQLANNKDWMTRIRSFFSSNGKRPYFALFLVGALNVFAYAPFGFWPYIFFSLALLFLSLALAPTARRGFAFGFYYGLGWFATGISWVYVAIADFGGLPLVVSILLMALLDAYLALFPALAGYLAVRYRQQLGAFALVPFWMAAEWLRSVVLTGFPWLSLGYSQTQSPLSALAPVVGEIGLQFVVLVMSLALFQLLVLLGSRTGNARRSLLATGTIFGCFLLAILLIHVDWTESNGKTVNISLVQGNVEQSIKWQPDRELPTMEKYLNLTLPELDGADVVIWPEAAIPRLEIISSEFLIEVDRIAAETNTAVITGIVDYQPDTNMAFNNLIVLGKKHETDEFGHYRYLHNNRFNKHHLLPIGEYIPFESVLRGLAPLFDLPMSSFSYGSFRQDNLIAKDIRLSPAICYEIAFSDQVRANLYQGDNPSDLILTVSNDAWFGDSHGPWQHLEIAQMRALEYAKPVVRVTNNGVTAFIDAKGQLLDSLPQFEEGVLRQELKLTRASTPYYRYGAWPIVLVVFCMTGAVLLNQRKRGADLTVSSAASNS